MSTIPADLKALFDDPEPIEESFGRLMELYGRAIGADRCLLFLYEPVARKARCTHQWVARPEWAFARPDKGWDAMDQDAVAREDPMFALALSEPEALFIDDIEKADPALVNAPYEIENFKHRGLVHAPLMENGVLWGILEPCVIAAPRAWTQADRDVTAWVQERLTPLAIRYVRANCPV